MTKPKTKPKKSTTKKTLEAAFFQERTRKRPPRKSEPAFREVKLPPLPAHLADSAVIGLALRKDSIEKLEAIARRRFGITASQMLAGALQEFIETILREEQHDCGHPECREQQRATDWVSHGHVKPKTEIN